MNAANTIEEAAKTLLEAKRKQIEMRKNKESPLPEEEITEAIIDACRAITTATGTLVNAATAAQKEIAAKGQISKQQSVYKRDPAWAKGLISAAQSVAGTVKDLVSAANKFIYQKKKLLNNNCIYIVQLKVKQKKKLLLHLQKV